MKRLYPGLAAAVTALWAPALAWAQRQPYSGYGYGHMWHDGWYGMVLGPLMMIVFIAAIVAVVVLLVRWLGGGADGRGRPGEKPPLDILEERFARGEIDKDEFEERRRVLRG